MRDRAVLVLLLLLAIQDLKEKEIDVLLPVGGTVICVLYRLSHPDMDGILYDCIPGLLLLLMAACFRESIGAGDGLIALLYGVIYGCGKTVLWISTGFLLTALAGIGLMLFGRRSLRDIPALPFLFLAHAGRMLCGN